MTDFIKKSNDTTIKILENTTFKYLVLISIATYILFLDFVSTDFLEIFDLTSTKILLALIIVYTACFDPLYAIAFTTVLIISIQELHRRRTATLTQLIKDESKYHNQLPSQIPTEPNTQQPSLEDLKSQQEVYNFINNRNIQKTHENDDLLIAQYDFYEDPAYQTITANLTEKNVLGHNVLYVSDNDLAIAQTNQVPGVNQNTSVKVFDTTIGAQGLPGGYDKLDKEISPIM